MTWPNLVWRIFVVAILIYLITWAVEAAMLGSPIGIAVVAVLVAFIFLLTGVILTIVIVRQMQTKQQEDFQANMKENLQITNQALKAGQSANRFYNQLPASPSGQTGNLVVMDDRAMQEFEQ